MDARTRDEELRLLVQRLARLIRNNRSDQSISDTQLGALHRLERDGVLTPGRLAELERVSPPSMNRTLNGLEALGLIARRPSVDDARKVDVRLTPAGHELIRATRQVRAQWLGQRVAELSADDRAALEAAIPVLRRLVES